MPFMEKRNEFSVIGHTLEKVREEIMPLFPTKAELIGIGLKGLLFPHETKNWFEIVAKQGRELGMIAGLEPFEQDIMSVWFLKRIQKQAYDYKREMGLDVGNPRAETDEGIVLIFINAISGLAGRPPEGEENGQIREWLFSLKATGDGLAKMIINRGCSDSEITAFMGERLRDTISKRVPFQDFIAPFLNVRTNLVQK